jgi:hypothetical protein
MAAACQRDASAQQIRTDPLGPIRCWQQVTAAGLTDESAVPLCSGAINGAPGQCYATAARQFTTLSTLQVQELCYGTTTLQPLTCYASLSEGGDLTEDQIIAYCGTQCPAGPAPPQTASPACAHVAMENGNLTIQQTGTLCASARSAGPALCFIEGTKLHVLSSQQLIDLCVDQLHCQYPGSPGVSKPGGGNNY